MKRVLVTGATGFVGAAVLRALRARDMEVHATSRAPPAGSDQTGATWHLANLLAPGEAERVVWHVRPTHLLHLAWTVTPGRFWKDPENLDWVAATLSLYRAFVQAGGRRFVGAGTCAEYDWSNPDLNERTTPLAPSTLYGQAKLSTLQLLSAASIEDGASLGWGRVFFVYGPGEKPGRLVSDVAVNLLQGQPALCGDGLQQRDFMHVEDLGRAFADLLDSAVTGPVNLASGVSVTIGQMVSEIARYAGHPGQVQLGARPRSSDDPDRLIADVTRLRDEVGFSPRYCLKSGVEDAVQWWKRRLAQGA